MDWVTFIAYHRALAMFYHTAHLQAKGDGFYTDHLLFERLYSAINDLIDPISEHAIGETNDPSLVGFEKVFKAMMEIAAGFSHQGDAKIIATLGLAHEKQIQGFIKANLKGLSIGADNFVRGVSEKHSELTYLLQQRVKNS